MITLCPVIDTPDLTSAVYDAEQVKKLPDDKNLLISVKQIYFLAKACMKTHGGYNRENLHDFMKLMSFILNDHKDCYEKADSTKQKVSTSTATASFLLKTRRPWLWKSHQTASSTLPSS